MQSTQDKPTMTVSEASKYVGVSLPTMYAITERKDFSALVRLGKRKLILKSKLLEWLEVQAANS